MVRTEQIKWKIRCKYCGKYYLKEDMHIIKRVCYNCDPIKEVRARCRATTKEGTRCKNFAEYNGFCKIHYRQRK